MTRRGNGQGNPDFERRSDSQRRKVRCRMAQIYQVDFCIVKKNTVPFAGKATQYRRENRRTLVLAATDQGIQAVLNADLALASGETVEIIHTQSVPSGTDGST